MHYSRRQTLQLFACTAALIPSATGLLSNSIWASPPASPKATESVSNDLPRGEVDKVKVMSFNIWIDGKQGGVPQTAEVINRCKPDIVGIQEVTHSGEELEKLTGMTFIRQRKGGILTRFLVVEASPNGLGVKLEVSPSREVWLFNVHLFHAPYQPYQLEGIPYGKDNPFISTESEAISEANRARGHERVQLLEDMQMAIDSRLPVFVTGDFNEPSHLDWTAEVKQAGKIKTVVRWPQSSALLEAGFEDAYRVVHPDPLTKPGYTWTPKPSAKDVLDRIDFVYSRNITPTAAFVVGESAENADIVVTPFPSDHRAVLVDFKFQ